MTDKFFLDQAFSDEKFKIAQLQLSYLLLNDNALFPWVILVPRRPAAREIIDLTKEDQYLLMDEIELVSKMMLELFKPDKLNIASFGNITPQLHVHIIARYKQDQAWPNSVFGGKSQNYSDLECDSMVNKIKHILTNP